MNNILTFEDYKKMNIRQVESVIYRQFVEEDIKDEVNEGIIRKFINKTSSNFIQTALADEIEKGKELEKSIKEALDGLNKGFEEIEKRIDADNERGVDSKSKLNAIEKVKDAIKAVQSQAFDTLTMIGSEGEIDFAGFVGSATVSAAANFGILFSPIRSLFITRKAYKYFLGIIKQTIRRNLLIIQLNFDQFENLILQKSFETEDDSESSIMRETLNSIILALQMELCGKDSKLKLRGKKEDELKRYLANFRETQNALIKQHKEDTKNNPLRSLWEDQHNNTYTRTLEQIKQYINDDSQKELDALKNSITKMAGNDTELAQYGELLISAAEEYAIHTNHGINNNFIKMSSVFNLENQKKLIEMIQKTQDENEKEIKRKRDNQDAKELKKKIENNIKEGKKIYEEKIKDKESDYTFDKFTSEFDEDDIKCLNLFFTSDEGKDTYKELKENHPVYKYLLEDITELNNFLFSINDLKVVETSDVKDLTERKSIVKKDQALYYIMAERSIKDAVNKQKSEPYFGFEDVEKIIDGSDSDDTLESDINNILRDNLFPTTSVKEKRKKRYFLTFEGSGNNLFNILHNDFKTEIFKDDKTYVDDISIDNKETIMKIIYKNFKIGNSISTQFAEYLVRLEAHMLLKSQDPFFVVKNNDELKDCFTDNMSNRNAFVEIKEEDFEDIKTFLIKYHNLSDNDFNIESDKKDNENK
jgi:hypothetical protein